MKTTFSAIRLRVIALLALFLFGFALLFASSEPAFAAEEGNGGALSGQDLAVCADGSEANGSQAAGNVVAGSEVVGSVETGPVEAGSGVEGQASLGSGADLEDVRAFDPSRDQDGPQGQDDQDGSDDQVQTGQAIADGIYRIASTAALSMTADIANGSVDAGANLRSWTWNTTEAQQYILAYDGATGTYTIRSAKSGLFIAASSDAKGSNVYQAEGDGSDLQRWYILPTAVPGRYTIASASGSFVWDIANGSTSKGANIRLWTANATPAQTWLISRVLDLSGATVELVGDGAYDYADGAPVVPEVAVTVDGARLVQGIDFSVTCTGNVLPGTAYATVSAAPGSGSSGTAAEGLAFQILQPTTPSIADGTYGVASKKHMARVMDIASGSVDPGANLQSYRWNTTEAQRYIFTFHEDGAYYTIVSAKSGLALTLQSADPKANVFQAELEEDNVLQRWYVLKSGDYFIIESVAGAVVLDIANGSTSSGANIRGYGFNDTDAQKWELFDPDSTDVRVAASKAMNQAVQRILDASGWSLWGAFDYIAHHYVWRWWYLYPSGDWMESYALHMYNTGGGNCYCYAALFTFCAWALGYPSMQAVSGLCTGLGGWTPHGWAQMNGKIYDADLYYESGFRRSGYAITNGSYLSYRAL